MADALNPQQGGNGRALLGGNCGRWIRRQRSSHQLLRHEPAALQSLKQTATHGKSFERNFNRFIGVLMQPRGIGVFPLCLGLHRGGPGLLSGQLRAAAPGLKIDMV
jgi:hypothetical protein